MNGGPGRMLSHYHLVKKIGEGSLGEVWQAVDVPQGRTVAVKLILPDRVGGREACRRLQGQATTAAALDHPFICKVIDVVEDEERLAIVMEHVDGNNLLEWAGAERISPSELFRVATEVAEALAAAHACGMVHRDLKPSNVMVNASRHVKVMDFGLPNRLQPGKSVGRAADVLGTAGYTAPDVLAGGPATARSDIFSLGCVLHHLACGAGPFEADSPDEIIKRTLEHEPRRASSVSRLIPPAFDDLLGSLLEKDPSQRSSSATDVAVALDRMRFPSKFEKRQRRGRGRRRRKSTMLVVGLAVAALLAAALLIRGRAAFAPGGLTAYDLAILPLIDPLVETPLLAQAGELRRKMVAQQSPTRIMPARALRSAYERDGEQAGALGEFVSHRASYTLRWEIDRLGTPPSLSVSLVSGFDGQIKHSLNYSLPAEAGVSEVLQRRLARDVEAFLFSARESATGYAAGHEQQRVAPITWSPEAARLYLDALMLNHVGRHWEARSSLDHALEIDDGFAQAFMLRSEVTGMCQRPYRGAALRLPDVERAMALRNRLEAWEGELLQREREFLSSGASEAIPDIEEALLSGLGAHRRSEVHSKILAFQGRSDDVLQYSLDRLSASPEPFSLWLRGPMSVLDLGYTPERIGATLRPLLETYPDHPMPHLVLGACLIAYPEAVEQAEVALARARELAGRQWQSNLAWVVGALELDSGRPGRAEQILLEGLAAEPQQREPARGSGDPRVYAFLAATYRRMGRLEDARRQIGNYRQLLPQNPWIDYESGRLFAAGGVMETAVEEYSRCIEKDPLFQHAYLERGRALRSLGRPGDALADLERYEQLAVGRSYDDSALAEIQREIGQLRRQSG